MKKAMLSALSHLPACTAEGWRKEAPSLPCIVAEDQERSVLARADGMPYLESYRARVEVYAASPAEADALVLQTDAALWALGLSRENCTPGYDEPLGAYTRTLTYKAVLCGEWIYQEG